MRSIPCPQPMSLPNGGRKESGRPDPGGEGEDKGAKPLILFNACKKEVRPDGKVAMGRRGTQS